MFKIGDRVKCINVSSLNIKNRLTPNLILNREYIVYGIKENKCCDSISLDVGLIQQENKKLYCSCCRSFIKIINIGDIQWCASIRFVKVQEKKEYIAVQSNVEVVEKELQLN